jgi:hypothetical protein
MSAVLPFGEPGCRVVAEAGGKGASLARMTSLGLPVPPGFVIPAGALAAALPDGGEELRALARRRDAEEAQTLIRTVELDPALREAVVGAYAGLGDGDVPVAVRSSATAEDSEEASFAGQQATAGRRSSRSVRCSIASRRGRSPTWGWPSSSSGWSRRTWPASCSRATPCASAATVWWSRPCSASERPSCRGT